MPAICAGYPCGCVPGWHGLLSSIQRINQSDPQKRPKFGLIRPYWYKIPKRIINPKKWPKIKPYGRVRFLSASQRAQRERKSGLLCLFVQGFRRWRASTLHGCTASTVRPLKTNKFKERKKPFICVYSRRWYSYTFATYKAVYLPLN